MVLQALFTADINLRSLFTIGFIVVMAAYVFCFVKRRMDETERARGKLQ